MGKKKKTPPRKPSLRRLSPADPPQLQKDLHHLSPVDDSPLSSPSPRFEIPRPVVSLPLDAPPPPSIDSNHWPKLSSPTPAPVTCSPKSLLTKSDGKPPIATSETSAATPPVPPADQEGPKAHLPCSEGKGPAIGSFTVQPIKNKPANSADLAPKPASKPGTPWNVIAKGDSSSLRKRGNAFKLDSGESCVKIPNELIVKNKKSWEYFVLGQFYSDPPSHGKVHSIVNGIWSKNLRDISVSKMEGFSYLFRIPNESTRNRVISQGLWQIDGQTMFVGKWEPGLVPQKPELDSAPIWLELRNVPFQCFNEEGLEYIASMVGEPKVLHPMTATKKILEVAKVLTVIDPRKPLPEAVNVQFESGQISRIDVSCPWMPPVCSQCGDIGHSLQKCKDAPITCKVCKSKAHTSDKCPRVKRGTQPDVVQLGGIPLPAVSAGKIDSDSHLSVTLSESVPSTDPGPSGLLPLEKASEKSKDSTHLKHDLHSGSDPQQKSLTSDVEEYSSDVQSDSSDVQSEDSVSDDQKLIDFTKVQTRRQKLRILQSHPRGKTLTKIPKRY